MLFVASLSGGGVFCIVYHNSLRPIVQRSNFVGPNGHKIPARMFVDWANDLVQARKIERWGINNWGFE